MKETSILIVDDDPGAAEAFKPMLRARGYDVRVAMNAAAGFEHIQRNRPAAILLDMHLPDIDGIEFVRRLRTTVNRASLPIAVITGDYLIDEQITADFETLGVQLYFKPLWEEDLVQIVAHLLNLEDSDAGDRDCSNLPGGFMR